ncbi:hypothetical protein CapIbe_016164 [Capra ibex]
MRGLAGAFLQLLLQLPVTLRSFPPRTSESRRKLLQVRRGCFILPAFCPPGLPRGCNHCQFHSLTSALHPYIVSAWRSPSQEGSAGPCHASMASLVSDSPCSRAHGQTIKK